MVINLISLILSSMAWLFLLYLRMVLDEILGINEICWVLDMSYEGIRRSFVKVSSWEIQKIVFSMIWIFRITYINCIILKNLSNNENVSSIFKSHISFLCLRAFKVMHCFDAYDRKSWNDIKVIYIFRRYSAPGSRLNCLEINVCIMLDCM